MAGYDEVVERVARAICATNCISARQEFGKCPSACTQWSRDEGEAAVDALQPGDEIGGEMYVVRTHQPAIVTLQQEAARRAREEMREACLVEQIKDNWFIADGSRELRERERDAVIARIEVLEADLAKAVDVLQRSHRRFELIAIGSKSADPVVGANEIKAILARLKHDEPISDKRDGE